MRLTSFFIGSCQWGFDFVTQQLLSDLFLYRCRSGVIQPSTISEEGRPVPVEHVLQLLEGVNMDPPGGGAGEGQDSD